MAGNLYVSEYAQLGLGAQSQLPQEPPIVEYKIAVGGGSTQGPQPFNAATKFVRLQCDATNPLSIAFGVFGVVTASSATNGRMAVNQTEYHAVPVNANFTVAAVTNI